ncbi:MAG: ribonuclease H-like domain-containing protein, partial [Planctomycetota bacterium]
MGLMSLEELRQKLEALNRGPLTESAGNEAAPGGRAPAGAVGDQVRPTPGVAQLERLIDGRELQVGTGQCYCISRRLSECWPGDSDLGPGFAAAMETAATNGTDPPDADLAAGVAGGAASLLFTDLETCGFAGTPVFLIGMMFWDAGDLCLEQVLARSYEPEPAILTRFAERLGQKPVLVSFNGKSFDWPFLCDRAAVHRVELPEQRGHCDLLHAARRRYRDQLPDCRLQTLAL